MSVCELCDRPVQDAKVCTRCGADLEKALAQTPWLDQELITVMCRQTQYAPQPDGGKSAETPLMFNPKASAAHAEYRRALTQWVNTYVAATKARTPRGDLASMSRFLYTRVEWIRHHDQAAQAVDTITAAYTRALHIIDSPANRTSFPVGPCPETIEETGDHCTGEVSAYIPTANDIQPRMSCSDCDTTYTSIQWLRAGKRIRDRKEQLDRMADLRNRLAIPEST